MVETPFDSQLTSKLIHPFLLVNPNAKNYYVIFILLVVLNCYMKSMVEGK